ncbi:hypothetical protein [Pantoea anthophila]|uniref:hypothetical protein n=1 Tax=Pantoea anthophila TaxID=470931 RepID=UPI002DBC76DB|nr:hypothetical protein [Pantoea anthophila]MEB5705905.1 hypothetical protein [Pantoea anthophila]MEB6516760.1 hypothetical protein [Pantoea anthophila]
MKSVQRVIKGIVLLIPALVCWPSLAQESCQGVSQVVVQVHNVNYVPGAADGTPISAQMPVQSTNAFTCNKNSGEQGYAWKDMGFQINAEESGLQTSIAGGHTTPIYRVPGVESIGFAIGLKSLHIATAAFSIPPAKAKPVRSVTRRSVHSSTRHTTSNCSPMWCFTKFRDSIPR